MTRWNDQESAGTGTFLLGAVAGALVGAGIALLMAPKNGAQMREDLSTSYGSVKDAAAKRYRDLADRANQKIGELEQKVEQYAGRASTTAKETINDVTSSSGYPRA